MSAVIWHDLECGAYAEDLELWRSLAAEHGDPVLDVGAGTGRVALDLAKLGHRVTALDCDEDLLAELARRAERLPLTAARCDARDFDLGERFRLCIVPMQTVQLLGGAEGRLAFLRCARRHLEPTGLIAIAIAETLDLYDVTEGDALAPPLPDICEVDGVVYSSQPTAVRESGEHFMLERRRDVISVDGQLRSEDNVIALDRLTPDELEQEGKQAGLHPAGRELIPATDEYVASWVVMLRA